MAKKKVASPAKDIAKYAVSEDKAYPVKKLQFFDNNPKLFDSKEFAKLKKSLVVEGQLEPILVNKRSGVVLDGNQRLKAIMSLGWETAWVVFYDVPVEKERKLLLHLNASHMPLDRETFFAMVLDEEADDVMNMLRIEAEQEIKKGNTGMNSEYQIVKEVDEKYNFCMFIFKKGVDFTHIETFFNLVRVYDPHRDKLLGKGRAIDGEKLIKLTQLANRNGANNIDELA